MVKCCVCFSWFHGKKIQCNFNVCVRKSLLKVVNNFLVVSRITIRSSLHSLTKSQNWNFIRSVLILLNIAGTRKHDFSKTIPKLQIIKPNINHILNPQDKIAVWLIFYVHLKYEKDDLRLMSMITSNWKDHSIVLITVFTRIETSLFLYHHPNNLCGSITSF